MSDQKETLQILKEWADIVIQRWISKISRLGIIETAALMRSFTAQVHTDAAGDASKIVFAFLYYGIFPDMGVGKGVKYDQVANSNRKAKPWFSAKFYSEVKILGHIMAERYGDRAIEAISIIENKGISTVVTK